MPKAFSNASARIYNVITGKRTSMVLALFFVFITAFTAYISIYAHSAHAATNSTINFQARILTSAGALVPDGPYSVEFKIYDAASGGLEEWNETQSVSVKNGYITASLGSVNAFGTSIDWSQEHWLTMNINGDGEMGPNRMKITAVPYAFRSGQADTLTTGSGTISAAGLLQLSPSSIQNTNSAVGALQVNQQGAGGLLLLQSAGNDILSATSSGLTLNGTGTSAFNLVNTGQLSVNSSLVSGARATPLVAITQANDATNNSTGVLLNVTNSDTATTAAVISIVQSSTAAANALTINSASTTAALTVATPAGGTAFAATGVTSGTALNANTVTTGTALTATGTTTGLGLSLAGTGLTTGTALRINTTSNALTTGNGLAITGASAAITANFTGSYLSVNPTRTLTAAATRTDTGSFLNLTRVNTVNNASGIYNLSGALATLSSNCVRTLGTCNDTANILNLSQLDTVSSGAVLNITGAGQGDGISLSATNTTGTQTNGFVFNRNGAGGTTTNGILVSQTSGTLSNGLTLSGTIANGINFSGTGFTNLITGTGITIAVNGDINTNGTIISGDITSGGIISATSFSGDGAALTNLDGTNIATGTVSDSRLSGSVTLLGNTFNGNNQLVRLNGSGELPAISGGNLTGLNANNISTGTVSDSRLSSNVGLLSTAQNYSATQTFSQGIILGGSSPTTSGALRWTGTDFEGYDGSSWLSLTTGSGGGGSPTVGITTIVKTADETVNNNNTLQDDNNLSFAIGANEKWTYRFVVQANSSATADLQFAVSAPSGATCDSSVINAEDAEVASNLACGASSGSITTNGTDKTYEIVGTIQNGSTSGSVVLRWAQFNLDATNTTVYSGSSLVAVPESANSSFIAGGNSFGSNTALGTNDNYSLALKTNGTNAIVISTSQNVTLNQGLSVLGSSAIGDTSGDVLTLNGSSMLIPNGLNIDTNTLVIDSTANTVGINNSNPGNPLSINTPATSDALAQSLIYTNAATNKGLLIQATASQTANLFELQQDTGLVLAAFGSDGQLVLGGDESTPVAGLLSFNDSTGLNGFTSVLGTNTLSSNRLIYLPDASGTICLTNSDDCGYSRFAQVSAQVDSTTNSSVFINKTGASGNIITLQNNGTSVFSVMNNGALQLQVNSTSAFSVKDSGGTDDFSIDTSAALVRIGSATPDGSATLLVLDEKNTTGDPVTGVNGGSYYNSFSGKSRCYENNMWQDCVSAININKTGDQIVTNNSTFQNDSALTYAMAANSSYTIDATINYSTTSATADFKYTFTVPAGATIYLSNEADTSVTARTICNITASGQTCALANTANFRGIIKVRGVITTAGTAGNLQFQFAQNTLTAAQSVTVYKGSLLQVSRTDQ